MLKIYPRPSTANKDKKQQMQRILVNMCSFHSFHWQTTALQTPLSILHFPCLCQLYWGNTTFNSPFFIYNVGQILESFIWNSQAEQFINDTSTSFLCLRGNAEFLILQQRKWLLMSCCKRVRVGTHRCSQYDEYVCIRVFGLLLSIKLLPELSKHLRATQSLTAHLLLHLLSPCASSSHSQFNNVWDIQWG